MRADTPLWRQYHGVKEQHPDKLLLFRMGDFYELFYADAERAAALLGITLTRRKSVHEPIPMAGVPAHTLEQYISRLVQIGESVVICEQVGEADGKGLMQRKVTQIVTPGTLTDPTLLPTRAAAVAMAVALPAQLRKTCRQAGYAWLDLARGEMRAGACVPAELANHVARLQPTEMLLAEGSDAVAGFSGAVTYLPAWEFDSRNAYERMCTRFGVKDLRGFDLQECPLGVAAAMALFTYAEHTQCQRLEHLWQVGADQTVNQVTLDEAARRSLEISVSQTTDGPTLLSSVDACAAAAGSRLMLRRLHNPIPVRAELEARQDLVAWVAPRAAELLTWLRGSCDLERIATRVALGSVRPRELGAVRDCLAELIQLQVLLTDQLVASSRLAALADDRSDMVALLDAQLAENPPAQLRDGGVIASGFDTTLDELRQLTQGSKDALVAIVERERANTGLTALRVGHNRVHGYYLELPRSSSDAVPAHYQRRQTIKHAERFVTVELQQLEASQATAVAQASARERSLYQALVTAMQPQVILLRRLGEALAELDLSCALATLTRERAWVRPEYVAQPGIWITAGRHPVIDTTVSHFVPNDTELHDSCRMQVITGPNMGGKSTYMRQVALIALLALAGMPVPAQHVRIGPLDAIKTRIGAADDLAAGRSTFMVEMAETASILNTAGPRSLVLLDEIGRGTSTFDGLSLAWATADALLRRNCSLVLLATHYLELAELAQQHVAVRNLHMTVNERGAEVVMLYRLEQGPANRSFGLHVARMAGIPAHTITAAAAQLCRLEQRADSTVLAVHASTAVQLAQLLDRLQQVEADALTLCEALALVADLQRLLRKDKSLAA